MQEDFENGVLDFLKIYNSSDLYVLSDFYDKCCELLKLDIDKNIKNYKQYKSKIYYRLNLMVKKGLITKNKIGTGFAGKTDFGMTYLNTYSLVKNI